MRIGRRPMRLITIPSSSRRGGFSMVEVAVMLAIVTIALGMFARTMASAKQLDPIATESAFAASAARTALEEMRNHPFEQMFALYDADPSDDPNGAGTGPGPHFKVPGLTSTNEAGWVGTISFPTVQSALREDVVDEALGMPRDLNADGNIDTADHAADCILLPIRVRCDWIAKNSKTSHRSFEMYTMYARY
jgi:type II secretory pathway pseudopilin PulG